MTSATHGDGAVKNGTDQPVKGKLKGQIESSRSSSRTSNWLRTKPKTWPSSPRSFRSWNLTNPRLWWPVQMGKPESIHAHMEFEVDGRSAIIGNEFGIREVTSELNSVGRAGFSHQRQEHPDSRRRLVSRHDAAGKLAAPA